jgi:hypothetical protein
MVEQQRAQTERHENDELHEEWLAAIGEQLAPVFEHSKDGVYLYLDDQHKICNDTLAKMWGFGSAAEWARTPDFLNSFIATHQDRLKVSRSYHTHIHQSLTPVRLRFSVRRPDGKLVRCEGDMVPLSHAGQMFAYHFVRKVPGTSRAKKSATKARRPAKTKKSATRARRSATTTSTQRRRR